MRLGTGPGFNRRKAELGIGNFRKLKGKPPENGMAPRIERIPRIRDTDERTDFDICTDVSFAYPITMKSGMRTVSENDDDRYVHMPEGSELPVGEIRIEDRKEIEPTNEMGWPISFAEKIYAPDFAIVPLESLKSVNL